MDTVIKSVPWPSVAKLDSYSMPEFFFKDLPTGIAEEIIEKGGI
jgi:hypothetical protein